MVTLEKIQSIVFVVFLVILSIGVFSLIVNYLPESSNVFWAMIIVGIVGMAGIWFYKKYG